MIQTKTILNTKTILFDFHKMAEEFQKSEVQQRFEMLIKHLNISVYALAKRLSVSQTRIWRALEKQKGVDTELLSLIGTKYPEINYDWVITGRGSMFSEEQGVKEQFTAIAPTSTIRIVYSHQQAEYSRQCLDQGYIRKLAYAPTGTSEPGTFRDFEMSGNQMEDTHGNGIHEGDVVRGQRIQQEHWQAVLQPGQVAIIITDGEIYIRMIKSHKKGILTLKAWNPMHPDIAIDTTTIIESWLYRSLITTRDWKYKLHE